MHSTSPKKKLITNYPVALFKQRAAGSTHCSHLVVVFSLLVQIRIVVLVHQESGEPFKGQAAALPKISVWFMSL